MLKLSEQLLGKSVLSLRTGIPVAITTGIVLNPDNFKIEGFYCQDNLEKTELILLYQDIRDVIARGIVINDHDVLVEPHELIRLKKILDIDYQLLGKKVYTTNKKRIGKVTDFATEVETLYIQKLYVSQGMLKGLTNGNLAVDRSQIVEVTDDRIIINDPLEEGAIRAGAVA